MEARRDPEPVPDVLLEARQLTKHFRAGGSLLSRQWLHAVDDVDLVLRRGEIVALVGESGSGKSTLARLLALVYRPTSGEVLFEGRPVHRLRSRKAISAYRSSVQLVFQDPFSFTNPFYRASHGVLRALKLYQPELGHQSRERTARELLETVGLIPGDEFMLKRPFELSGGQLQRYGFAQALACRPRVILADEPLSMLDVSIRIGILNLMRQLRSERGLTFLYITHDIASACYVADRVVVLYGGHVVEMASVRQLLARSKHAYTELLLGAAPDPRLPVAQELETEEFEPPQVIDPGEGCRFCERCPGAVAECSVVTPRLRVMGDGHKAACHVAVPDSDEQSMSEIEISRKEMEESSA